MSQPDVQSNQNHSSKKAMLLSIIPGLGQWYNQRRIKGSAIFILFLSFTLLMFDYIATGFQGLITLGTIPREHDSRVLLIEGLIALIFTVFYIVFYIAQLNDAKNEAKRIQRGEQPSSVMKRFRQSWDTAFPYVLIGPGFLMLIFVVLLPLLFMAALAFSNYNLYNAPPRNVLDWIGFSNFTNLFTLTQWRDTFFSVFTWTLTWTFVATTLQIALAMFLAIIVNDPRVKFKKFIRTILILPWAVPGFVSIIVFSALFNDNFGAINTTIIQPLFNTSIPWMSSVMWTRIAIISIQVWLGFPYVYALFTGVLQSISRDWYEAAEMDGASRWQSFKNITFPHLMYATGPLLLTQYTFNFNNFNIIYLFNEGGPAVRGQNAGGTDILISWVYNLTFNNQQFSMAAAISLILGLVIAVFAFFQFRRSSSFTDEGRF
ncbi:MULTISPECIES: carbohydrate ABC transporter permease [Dolosigranulum]|uniref:Maltose/maltodextrin transport system permease protein n=1 Tax=Dolosigranulum savutiense TaxID=3110288 RepID=A0AB74U0V0_9LACT|nr:sugar ABC transporter permease [Dolosigranulum pigrum]QJS97363.1 sugar ABC transporter permease [Dolosigranulum pigrum]QTJ35299.1 sugar ABC transporter permease [Dolosigranulum pigrum]QTJ40468.1 sugar ABC transporter permease [Dolosigranulum pigrum]QTJ48952.1 sugar ABC transporter permease [Dolosigranulum pigrum]QTJ52440.1 sugar ABC transporter permease [Dolosigranulum pigrum]